MKHPSVWMAASFAAACLALSALFLAACNPSALLLTEPTITAVKLPAALPLATATLSSTGTNTPPPSATPQPSATRVPTTTPVPTDASPGPATVIRPATPVQSCQRVETYECRCRMESPGARGEQAMVCDTCLRCADQVTPAATEAWMATFVPVTPVPPTLVPTRVPPPTQTPKPTAVIFMINPTTTPCSRLGAYKCNCQVKRSLEGESVITCDLCVVCAGTPVPTPTQ